MLGGAVDLLEVRMQRRVRRDRLRERQFGEAEDARQDVAEIVSQAAGHAGGRLELLLADALLDRLRPARRMLLPEPSAQDRADQSEGSLFALGEVFAVGVFQPEEPGLLIGPEQDDDEGTSAPVRHAEAGRLFRDAIQERRVVRPGQLARLGVGHGLADQDLDPRPRGDPDRLGRKGIAEGAEQIGQLRLLAEGRREQSMGQREGVGGGVGGRIGSGGSFGHCLNPMRARRCG